MTFSLKWRRRMHPASEWFARGRARGDQALNDSMTAWMAASPTHEDAVVDRYLAWELSEQLRDTPRIAGLIAEADALLARRPQAARRWAPWVLGGAAIAASLVVGWFLLTPQPVVADYATRVGEQRTVVLADQTVIKLNTDTRLRVRYARHSRTVELAAGEALFLVHHDAKRPFAVKALSASIADVGTDFDVRVSDAAVSISVLHGAVAVGSTPTSHGPPVAVSAGMAIDYAADGTMSAQRPADLVRIAAWQSQRVVYSNAPLVEALSDYNRYAERPIVLGNPTLASRRINGVFRIGEEEAFVHALEGELQLSASTIDGKIVLQAR